MKICNWGSSLISACAIFGFWYCRHGILSIWRRFKTCVAVHPETWNPMWSVSRWNSFISFSLVTLTVHAFEIVSLSHVPPVAQCGNKAMSIIHHLRLFLNIFLSSIFFFTICIVAYSQYIWFCECSILTGLLSFMVSLRRFYPHVHLINRKWWFKGVLIFNNMFSGNKDWLELFYCRGIFPSAARIISCNVTLREGFESPKLVLNYNGVPIFGCCIADGQHAHNRKCFN